MNELKLRRGRLGLTMQKVSDVTKLSYTTIWRAENEKVKPNASTYAILTDYYDQMEKKQSR